MSWLHCIFLLRLYIDNQPPTHTVKCLAAHPWVPGKYNLSLLAATSAGTSWHVVFPAFYHLLLKSGQASFSCRRHAWHAPHKTSAEQRPASLPIAAALRAPGWKLHSIMGIYGWWVVVPSHVLCTCVQHASSLNATECRVCACLSKSICLPLCHLNCWCVCCCLICMLLRVQ